MPKLLRNGIVISEFPTRAQCIVDAFERNLVHDQYQRRKRNSLLPGVSIEGEDIDVLEEHE